MAVRSARYIHPDLERRIDKALASVREELIEACRRFDPMRSPHEGYAVILEELDELWAEVKADKGDSTTGRAEAIQLAAMAIRYLVDVADGRRYTS